MMNRQIRVEKIIGTVTCVANCGAIEMEVVDHSGQQVLWAINSG